jgi:hypothetical protein
MFTISSLKSFIAGFVSVSTLTFVKLRKHSFTEAKIALEKDFMTITRDKNQANYKLKTKYERTT